MPKSILGTCLQSVSMVKNGCTAHQKKPFWHKPIRRRGEEQQGCQGNRGLAYTHPHPSAPALAQSLYVWVGYLISLTPWVWADQLPLIRTSGRETSQANPHIIRVKDVVMDDRKQTSAWQSQGSLVLINQWQISRLIRWSVQSVKIFGGYHLQIDVIKAFRRASAPEYQV